MERFYEQLNQDEMFELYKQIMAKAEELAVDSPRMSIANANWRQNVPVLQESTTIGNYLLLAKDPNTSVGKCEHLCVENFRFYSTGINCSDKYPKELEDVFVSFMLKKMPKEWEEEMIKHQLDDKLGHVGFYVGALYRAAKDLKQRCGDELDYASEEIFNRADELYCPSPATHHTSDLVVKACEKKIRQHMNELKEKICDEEEEKH